jgi:hypothetical protein
MTELFGGSAGAVIGSLEVGDRVHVEACVRSVAPGRGGTSVVNFDCTLADGRTSQVARFTMELTIPAGELAPEPHQGGSFDELDLICPPL